jgi:hypothetical protein
MFLHNINYLYCSEIFRIMANNDRLKQIISDIRQISDLTDSMKDSEIYPVSFFSQAFDLMQKIQSEFHLLEADQVEMFASQMKKHQALILSIHQQMRNIEGITPPASATAPPASPPVPPAQQGPARVTIPEYNIAAGQNASKQKKAFFLDRLGIHKNEAATNTEKQSTPEAPPTVAPVAPPETKTPTTAYTTPEAPPETGRPTVHTVPESPVTKIIEDSAAEFSTARRPARPMPNPLPVSETARTTEKSTITIPVTNRENLLHTSGSPVPKNPAERNKIPEAKYRNASNGIPTEGNFPPSVNDAIEKRMLSDLRRAFSLNDRFRYRHELFRDNEEVMNKVISILNNKESYKESIQFLEEKLHWDFSNPTVKDFIKVLELRFL